MCTFLSRALNHFPQYSASRNHDIWRDRPVCSALPPVAVATPLHLNSVIEHETRGSHEDTRGLGGRVRLLGEVLPLMMALGRETVAQEVEKRMVGKEKRKERNQGRKIRKPQRE